MALTSSKQTPIAFNGALRRKAYTIGSTATTFYAGEFIMVGGDDDLAKVMSGSSVAGNQFVGVVLEEQDVPAGGKVNVYEGDFALSGSGFTASDTNKLAYAATSAAVLAAHAEGRLPIGKYKYTNTDFGQNNAIFEVGTVASGSSF